MTLEFLRRGAAASGLGPIVLAVLYLILQHRGVMQTLTVTEVCLGIFSLSALAFVAGGMNVLYQIERLPLMLAILIHGAVLYISYLATYLINGWLDWGTIPILVFSLYVQAGMVTRCHAQLQGVPSSAKSPTYSGVSPQPLPL